MPKSRRPSWKMASVENVRQIQINHPQFSEPPGWVQPPKSGFASNLEMHTNWPQGLGYLRYTRIIVFLRFLTFFLICVLKRDITCYDCSIYTIEHFHLSFFSKMLLFVPNKLTKTELFGKRRWPKAASKGCNSYTEFRISLIFRTQFIFQSIINILGYWTSKLSIFVLKSEKWCRKIREKRPF